MMRLIWLVLTAIFFASCAGRPPRVVDVEECVSDPASGGFQCSQGTPESAHLVKYVDSKGYVAHTPAMDQIFWNACLLSRKGK